MWISKLTIIFLSDVILFLVHTLHKLRLASVALPIQVADSGLPDTFVHFYNLPYDLFSRSVSTLFHLDKCFISSSVGKGQLSERGTN